MGEVRTMPKPIGAYQPNSNIITTISIKLEDRADYLKLRQLIRESGGSIGDYLMTAYRELDKETKTTSWIQKYRRGRYEVE